MTCIQQGQPTRSYLARVLHLLDQAPPARPIDHTCTPFTDGRRFAAITPQVDAHLHAVGERARSLASPSTGGETEA